MSEVPDDVDLAVIAAPAAMVLEVVEECAAKGVHALVVLSAGFAETGDEGRALQDEVLEAVRAHGMRMAGPNCLGLVNTDPDVRLNAIFGRPLAQRGRVALSSRSGAMGLAIIDYADELGIGLSQFVSVGNKSRRVGQRPPRVLGARRLHGGDRAIPRVVRQPSTLRPHRASRRSAEADARREERARQAGARAARSHTAALAGHCGRRTLPSGRDPAPRYARGAVRCRGAVAANRWTGEPDRHDRVRDAVCGGDPGVPLPRSPAHALAHAIHYRQWLERPPGGEPDLDGTDAEDALALFANARARDAEGLAPGETARLMRAAGIRLARQEVVSDAEEAGPGGEVA